MLTSDIVSFAMLWCVLDVKVGDRCAVEPYLNCGVCVACRREKPNCCESLQVLGVHVDGGMRERITVPANKLHKSELLACDQLALVETLGIGSHVHLCGLHRRVDHAIGLLVDYFDGTTIADVLVEEDNVKPLCEVQNKQKIRIIAPNKNK